MKNYLTYVLLISFLVNCSSSKDKDIVDEFNFSESESAKITLTKSSVNCEDWSDCPSFAGALFYYEEVLEAGVSGASQLNYRIGLCSQQLIAPNKILTNRHCLPSDVTYKGAPCKGKIFLKFPETSNYKAESIDCHKVIDLSDSYKNGYKHLDWAILELESSVDRPFTRLNQNGIPDKKVVTAFPTYFTTGSTYINGNEYKIATGIIKKVNCVTNMSTLFGPYYDKKSSLFVANRCSKNIISGNSGSGLFNDRNELIGVISYALIEDNKLIEYPTNKKSVVLKQTILGGTNLHCIPYFNNSPDPMCYFKEESIKDLQNLSYSAARFRVIENISIELKTDLTNSYLEYFETPYYFHDFIFNLSSHFAKLPQYLVRDSMYKGLNNIITNFPKCVDKDAPDNFEEELAFLKISDDNAFSLNSHFELVASKKDIHMSHYLLSYKKEMNSYKINFVQLQKKIRNKMRYKKEILQRMNEECKNSEAYYSKYACNNAKKFSQGITQWVDSLNIKPSIIENENILQDQTATLDLSIPICD